MAEGGIFLDILTRLNMASVERVLKDVKTIMRDSGVESGRAFSEGFKLEPAMRQFQELSEASNMAFRDMQRGLANLQIEESRINEARARGFKRTSEVMIQAQHDLDAAIANSTRLMAESNAAAARQRESMAAIPARGSDRGDRGDDRGSRGVPPVIGRAANVAGVGAALGTAAFEGEGIRTAASTQRTMARVGAEHQDSTHNAGYISRQTQGIYQMASQVPYSPEQLAGAYRDIENHGYTGEAALNVLKTAAQTATATQADLKDTTDGLTTTLKDFGTQAELNSTNVDTYKQGLSDLNQQAGQLVLTFGNLKNVNPDEFFRSLGTVESIGQKYMSGLPGPAASAQINAALGILSQAGIGPEQGAHNISRVAGTLGSITPGGKTYSMLGQLGVKPEDVVLKEQNQGMFPALQMINDAIKSKTDPKTGMVDIGWRFNNEQISELINQDQSNLSDKGKAFVEAHPEINKGTASNFKLKKMMNDEGMEGADAQDILTLSQWQAKANGPNRFTKQGEPTQITPGQAYQVMFGTGDIARTSAILGGDAENGQKLANQLTTSGTDALPNAFKDMMSTLPEQWKQLGANLQALSGEMNQHLLPTLIDTTKSINEFISNHEGAAKAIVEAMGAVAAAWLAVKLKIPQAGKWAWDNFKPNYQGGYGPTDGKPTGAGSAGSEMEASIASGGSKAAEEMGAAIISGGTKAAEAMAAAVGGGGARAGEAIETAEVSGGLRAGEEMAGAIQGAGVTASEEMAAGVRGAGVEAGSAFASSINPALIGTLIAQAFYDNTDPSKGFGKDAHDTLQRNGILPGEKPGGKPGEGQPNLGGSAVQPQPGQESPTDRIKHFFGFALGGVAGYAGGTDSVNPFSQPLMGQPDMKRDSILGTLGGKPVGLRGGEGILTPEAVSAIGGKDAIDKLNNNPWSNPMKVGTTFFGSFADGVAKYSPWGKYLKAAGQSLSSMEKASGDANEVHGGRGPTEREMEQFLSDTMSPEQLEAMGVKRGKRGGMEMPDGTYLPKPGGGGSKGSGYSKGVAQYIYQSAVARGYSPSDATAIVAYSVGESHLDPKISGGVQGDDEVIGLFQEKAGFARSGGVDPSQRGTVEGNTTAYLNQLQGHRGQGDIYNQLLNTSVGGPMYTGGRGYMDKLYGQAQDILGGGDSASPWWGGGKADGGVVGYSGGGVVGFAGGGMPDSPFFTPPAPAPPPAGPTAQNGLAPMDQAGKAQPAGPTPGNGLAPMDQGGKSPAAQPGKQPAPPKGEPGAKPPGAEPGTTKPGQPAEGLSPKGDQPGNYPTAEKDRNIQANPSRAGGQNNTSKGFGVSGGIIGAAEGAAAAGANAFAPGSGQAANVAFQLANRAIGYAGQLAGIGISGLMETFLPNDSALADPTNGLFGKMALGIAGAHPSPQNSAGGSGMQLKPKEDLDQGAAAGQQVIPQVHMENTTINHNGGDVTGQMQKAVNQALFGGALGG